MKIGLSITKKSDCNNALTVYPLIFSRTSLGNIKNPFSWLGENGYHTISKDLYASNAEQINQHIIALMPDARYANTIYAQQPLQQLVENEQN